MSEYVEVDYNRSRLCRHRAISAGTVRANVRCVDGCSKSRGEIDDLGTTDSAVRTAVRTFGGERIRLHGKPERHGVAPLTPFTGSTTAT